MSNVQYLNPKAEVLKKIQALAMNINAAMGLQDVMKSNLGPKGTLKMYPHPLPQARRRRRTNQTHQGRQRPPPRNANPTPHRRHDRPLRHRTRRHRRRRHHLQRSARRRTHEASPKTHPRASPSQGHHRRLRTRPKISTQIPGHLQDPEGHRRQTPPHKRSKDVAVHEIASRVGKPIGGYCC